MTYAPEDLLAVRRYLLSVTGLPSASVGIVGDDNHPDGYHVGNDALAKVGKVTSDYSKRESSRDRPGSNAASALDVGSWSGRRGAARVTFLEFSAALVGACRNGDPRAADIREIIYTPDGLTVHRYDRLGIRSSGDSSHLYHTHISLFRTSEGRRAGTDNLLGLIRKIFEGDDMADFDATNPNAWTEARRIEALVKNLPATIGDGTHRSEPNALHEQMAIIEGKVDAVLDAVRALAASGAVGLTEQQVEDAAYRAAQRAENT